MESLENQPPKREPPVKVRGPGPRPGPAGKTRHIVLAHVLLVLTLLVYAGSLNNQFVLRDEPVIEANRWVRSLGNAPVFFRPSFWRGEMGGVLSGYRPVALVTYAADFSVWRKDALGFHLTNLFVHGLAVVAFFFLARRLVRDDGLAFVGSLLFAFHPLASEGVCYLASRATLIAWGLTLAAWLAWWRSWQEAPGERPRGRRRGSYLAALALHGLASGASPASAVLPLLQSATLALAPGAESRRRGLWRGLAPFVLLSLGALALNWYGAEPGRPFFPEGEGAGSFPAGLVGTALMASRLVLFPLRLVAERPLFEADPAWMFLSLFVLGGLLLLIARGRLQRSAFSLAVLAASLVPAFMEAAFRGEAYGEHLLYGAAGGFTLLLLALVYEAPSGPGAGGVASGARLRVYLVACLVAVGLAFASLTARRHMAWENSWTISRATLRARPDNAALQARLGRLWLEAGDLRKAGSFLEKLRSEAPHEAETWLLEGEVTLAGGRPLEAARAFGRAASIRPEDPSAGGLEVSALLEAGRLEEAEEKVEEYLARHPNSPELLYAKGLSDERRGAFEEALQAYRRSTALAPHEASYHLAQGRAAKRAGRKGEAEEAFRAAIREAPGLLEAYGGLAGLLIQEGRSREAIYLLGSVVRWHPEEPELAVLLARAWTDEGYPERAIELYRTILDNHPQDRRAPAIRRALAELEKNHEGQKEARQ